MYIKKIELKRIRCFDEIKINLNSSANLNKWLVILGNNGVGKTTLLRSIAIGLCDATTSASLVGELYGDLVRENEKNGEIIIELSESKSSRKKLVIHTFLEKSKSGYIEIKQTTSPKNNFPWEKIFVCGYGASRRGYGTKDYIEYGIVEAVYTLFNYEASLQNPELVIRRIMDTYSLSSKDILKWIDELLMLPPKSTKLGKTGLVISGHWGKFIPIGALGDGYQSILGWILDLLGWVFLYYEKDFERDPVGIVLLDELEQHLHPRWQRKVISLIRQKFPRMQFITTTHSPLCVLSITDLKKDEYKIGFLDQEEESVNYIEINELPRGQRVDRLLTSYLFGLNSASDDETKEEIEKYSKLLGKREKTTNDKREILELKKILNMKLDTSETEFERLVSKSIKKEFNKYQNKSNINKESVDLEVVRQIKELLS